ADAIGMCSALGVTTSLSSNTVKVVQKKPGTFLTVSGSSSIFSWGPVTDSGGIIAPTNGGASTCTGNATGKYATSLSTTTLATNLAAAIQACTHSVTGVTASSSTNTVTVIDTLLGRSTTLTVG